MNHNGKIIVTNIIVVVLAVVSIATLCMGNFFAVNFTFHINEEVLGSFAEKQMDEGEEAEFEYAEVFKDVNIDVPFSFALKSRLLLQAATGDASEAARTLLKDQLDVVVEDLLKVADDVIKIFAKVMVNAVVEQAKAAIYDKLSEELGSDPTEEQVMEELRSEYGISEEDLDALSTEITDAMTAFFDGGPNGITQTLEESQTLDNLISVYAEQALIDEHGEGNYSQEQIDAKTQELKDEIIDQFDEAIGKWAPEGEMTEDGIVVWLFNKISGDEGADIHNLEDVKNYILDIIFEQSSDDIFDSVGMGLKGLGAFLLVVIAAWAYLVLKIIVKLFARNKTVGMFFPKFFGWMPHVFFVGIPSLITNSLPKLLTQFADRANLDAEMLITFREFANMITIKFSALTWVSALCSLALTVIWFFYHKWRRDAKRAKKAAK